MPKLVNVRKTDWLTGLQLNLTQRGFPYWIPRILTYLIIYTSFLNMGLISHPVFF